MVHFWPMVTTEHKYGNTMLEVKPARQRGRNDKEATSEAFARWLHHQHTSVKLPSAGAYRFAARYFVLCRFV